MQSAQLAATRPLAPVAPATRPAVAPPRPGTTTTLLPTRDAGDAAARLAPGASNRGRKRAAQMMNQMPTPPVPPIDPDNEEFVLFVRAKKLPQWMPLSIVKGGAAANMMVKAVENDLGKKLYGDALVRNLGQMVYKDRAAIETEIKKMPGLAKFSEFEYGFKIRDKANPKAWYLADATVQKIPAEEDLPKAPVDAAKETLDNMGAAAKEFMSNFKIG